MHQFNQGQLPLLISFPHSGTQLPEAIARRMTPAGRSVADTDWYLPRLYDFDPVPQASQIRADFSRYTIDLNRSLDGANLYPGRPTPRLCPLQRFDGCAIYKPGVQPDEPEIAERVALYWQPYHDQIREELDRLVRQFGFAVLFDAHSIASRVPRLFDGQLPDINIGTANSTSCDPSLESAIAATLQRHDNVSHVINGRFIGGYITRHFGNPVQHVHAVQLELSQITYMDETTAKWHDGRAQQIRPVLQEILNTIARWESNNE